MGEMSKFLSVRQDLPPSPEFPKKVQGKGWVQQFFDIFGKKGDTWCMILEYNPAGYCFVSRELVLIDLFQLSHNCVTE